MYRLSKMLLALTVLLVSSGVSSAAEAPPKYDLELRLLDALEGFEAHGTVELAATLEDRSSITLGLTELTDGFEVEIIAPQISAGPATVRTERVEGHAPGWATDRIEITPARAIPAGEAVVLSFSYRAQAGTAFVYHLGQPSTFASGINTAWYPQVLDPLAPADDWDGLRSVGVVTFLHPEGYLVHTAGRPVDTETEGVTFDFEEPVYFSFAVGPYRVVGPEIGRVVGLFLSDREYQQSYLTQTGRVLEELEQVFGTYPHWNFAVVEVPTEAAHEAGFAGASVDGFIMVTSSFVNKRFNTAYFGHEVAHQWWGNLLTTTTERGAMMFSEGMSQFGSLVAVTEIDGPEMAERYRRTGYPGYIDNQSALGYLEIAASGLDLPIAEANSGYVARILADGKGFQVWNMLANEVGPERLFEALRSVVEEHTLKPVLWDDFLTAVEEAVGEDLGWFFAQWFDRPGAPDLNLSWSQSETLDVFVEQLGDPYRLTLEIEVEAATGCRQIHRVSISEPITRLQIPVDFPVKSVTLDPGFEILRWTPEYRKRADSHASLTLAKVKEIQESKQEALTILENALSAVIESDQPDPDGQRFATELAIARAKFHLGDPEQALEHLEAAARQPIRIVSKLPWLYYWMGRVALETGEESAVAEAVKYLRVADEAAGGDTGAWEAFEELRR